MDLYKNLSICSILCLIRFFVDLVCFEISLIRSTCRQEYKTKEYVTVPGIHRRQKKKKKKKKTLAPGACTIRLNASIMNFVERLSLSVTSTQV
jgi:hypothetical protein